MRVEEQYTDVLQNIEKVILEIYREEPALLDYDVEAAYDALISYYRAKQIDRPPKPLNLQEREEEVFDKVQPVCEWRLGGESSFMQEKLPPEGIIDIDVLLACLKRLKKSVQKWTRMGGRQGYLNFIRQYVL